jgi:predicted membrane metal-binding protein
MLSISTYSHEIMIASVIVAVLVFLFHRSVRQSASWRATVTPLASIIGSGFLVVAPLLHSQFGRYAPFAMLALVVFGYGVGFVLRENIATDTTSPPAKTLKNLARIALLVAYLVSVAFYIELLSDFLVHGFGIAPDAFHYYFYRRKKLLKGIYWTGAT